MSLKRTPDLGAHLAGSVENGHASLDNPTFGDRSSPSARFGNRAGSGKGWGPESDKSLVITGDTVTRTAW